MPCIKLSDLAKKLNAELIGNRDLIITSISSIDSAKQGDITFIVNSKYRKQLINCKASAIILKQDDLPFTNINSLVVKDPYLAYAYTAQIFDTTPSIANNIALSAKIDPSSQLGKNVSIGHNAIIESEVIIGNNVTIGPGCFIGKKTKIGNYSYLWANTVIYHEVYIGEKCLIHSGSIIGSDGFGYANNHGNWIKIPQLGKVIIRDFVEIGSCTTIDRGSLDNTVIGNGVIIDNHCHIAHNVIIGNNTAIAGGVIIAGSTKIGNYCMIGGASVIKGHIEICDKVIITGMGMVIRSINEPGTYSSGIPLQPNKIWRKTASLVMNIDRFNKRLKLLEQNK